MHYAIFADLHDSTAGLTHVLRDAQRRHVDQFIYLGDAGHNPALFDAVRSLEAQCVFGNWEVSGYRRLSPPLSQWVGSWPAARQLEDVICCHATPDMPKEAKTTANAAAYMAKGFGWHDLFPRLHLDEEARWSALAMLETENLHAAFHGHTHIQTIWRYGDGRWREIAGPTELILDPVDSPAPARYLIGVGSAGAPQDGPHLRYAVYDSHSRTVTCIQLAARG